MGAESVRDLYGSSASDLYGSSRSFVCAGAWLHARQLEQQVTQVETDIASLSAAKVMVMDEQ